MLRRARARGELHKLGGGPRGCGARSGAGQEAAARGRTGGGEAGERCGVQRHSEGSGCGERGCGEELPAWVAAAMGVRGETQTLLAGRCSSSWEHEPRVASGMARSWNRRQRCVGPAVVAPPCPSIPAHRPRAPAASSRNVAGPAAAARLPSRCMPCRVQTAPGHGQSTCPVPRPRTSAKLNPQ